ncbi:MAG: HAD-IB family hydrolase [Dehalococcoidales bacterium]|nr:HAD-IB family hydrolase [Dehalococcoidales bacterium]
MAQSKTVLAIFDFDGTLTTGHLWSGLARYHFRHRVRRKDVLLYFFAHLPFYLASRTKIYSEEKNRAKWGEDLPMLFKGMSREEAVRAFTWVTDCYFMSLMRPDVLEILNDHRKRGHGIMLLSGMLTDFLETVGQRIGADYVVGTRLEMADSRYTGRIVQPLCFGTNKAVLLSSFIERQHLSVDWESSTAYADSIFDTSVFGMVGRPVAVYPDKELHKLALTGKWKIIDENTKE